jgi:hypothetical protein
MRFERFPVLSSCLLAAALGAAPPSAAANPADPLPDVAQEGVGSPPGRLVEQVRAATRPFRDLAAAQEEGYELLHGCVSGPSGGAMGVHYANGGLVGDGALHVATPEVLMYEWRGGSAELVGVEYVVLAEDWHAANAAPPVLGGQLFHLSGAPNRYGIPAFYELHVWAWRSNPDGVFADWNPNVSCAGYEGEPAGSH